MTASNRLPSHHHETATQISALSATLRSEMNELRGMVSQLLTRPSADVSARKDGDVPEELQAFYTQLLQNAVAEELARDILNRAKQRLAEVTAALELRHKQKAGAVAGGGAVPAFDPKKLLRELIPPILIECIEKMLPDGGPIQMPQGAGPRLVALVGPTGVGKTTTVAKLAAHFKLREKKRVGLITIDTYRIAAVEQLRAYADILSLPLKVALTPPELAEAIRDFQDFDLILVDTAGRSQKNRNRLTELQNFLAAARGTITELSGTDAVEASQASGCEVHLVLSCAAHPEQLAEVAREFSFLGLDRVMFTKVDEAVGLGVILNVVNRLKLQTSYLTTGQEVPDDIEVGRCKRIAELILGRTAGASSTDTMKQPASVDQVA